MDRPQEKRSEKAPVTRDMSIVVQYSDNDERRRGRVIIDRRHEVAIRLNGWMRGMHDGGRGERDC